MNDLKEKKEKNSTGLLAADCKLIERGKSLGRNLTFCNNISSLQLRTCSFQPANYQNNLSFLFHISLTAMFDETECFANLLILPLLHPFGHNNQMLLSLFHVTAKNYCEVHIKLGCSL